MVLPKLQPTLGAYVNMLFNRFGTSSSLSSRALPIDSPHGSLASASSSLESVIPPAGTVNDPFPASDAIPFPWYTFEGHRFCALSAAPVTGRIAISPLPGDSFVSHFGFQFHDDHIVIPDSVFVVVAIPATRAWYVNLGNVYSSSLATPFAFSFPLSFRELPSYEAFAATHQRFSPGQTLLLADPIIFPIYVPLVIS